MVKINEFDPSQVEDNYDLIPAGVYPAVIVKSEHKVSKAGNDYIKMEFVIIDGKYRNRKLWYNLNLGHPNEVAREIAQVDLKRICESTGVGKISDTEELHNKPLLIRVGVKQSDDYGDQNVIMAFQKEDQKKSDTKGAFEQFKKEVAETKQETSSDLPF